MITHAGRAKDLRKWVPEGDVGDDKWVVLFMDDDYAPYKRFVGDEPGDVHDDVCNYVAKGGRKKKKG